MIKLQKLTAAGNILHMQYNIEKKIKYLVTKITLVDLNKIPKKEGNAATWGMNYIISI